MCRATGRIRDHVRSHPCGYLRCALYRLRAGLFARSVRALVGHCCACNYWSAAGRGDDHGNDRNGDCALVRVDLRVHRERHARAVRSAKKTRDPWAVSFVRNPMYIGAGMTLAGAALFYQSLSIFIYTGVFFLITHLFVVLYEEPTLRRTFGDEYEAYFRRVRRWAPGKVRRR